MKKVISAALVFLVFGFVKLDGKSVSDQIYKDEKNKVSFHYPSGWKKKNEGQRIYFESPDSAVKIYYVVREKETGKSAYLQVESFFAEIGTANEWSLKRSEVPKEQLALWGVSEGSYGYGTRMAREETRFYAVLAMKNNLCFILEAQLLKSKDQKYKSAIFNVFKTLKIEK